MFQVMFFWVAIAGGVAAMAPVVIHLLMRTRPKRVSFPALRFVRKSQQATRSRLRLRHLLLLACRVAIILLLGLLLARPRWGGGAHGAGREPVAGVFVLDTSASMACRRDSQSRLERARELSAQTIELLPEGSHVALIPSESVEAPALLSDRKLVARQAWDVPQTPGNTPLEGAIARAVAVLRESDLSRRVVYVASDLTPESWRADWRPEDLMGIDVVVLDCSAGEDLNFAVTDLRISDEAPRVGREVAIACALRAGRVGGQKRLLVEFEGRPLEQRVVALAPGQRLGVSLKVTPTRDGVCHGRLLLGDDDCLPEDNTRNFTLHVAPRPAMLVLRDRVTIGAGDAATFVTSSAIAPAGDAREPWMTSRTLPVDAFSAADLARVQLVLLSNVSVVPDAGWALLDPWIRAGGGVWIVPGPLSSPDLMPDGADALLPARLDSAEVLSPAQTLREADPSHPMLEPFRDEANPPLSDARLTWRMRVRSVASDAEVPLRYTDGVPATTLRRVDDGRVLLWNFCPTRECSNLAKLPQLPILARRTAEVLIRVEPSATMHRYGQIVDVLRPQSQSEVTTWVYRPGAGREERLPVSPRSEAASLIADRLGHWEIRFGEGPTAVRRGFSVNSDDAECDLSALTDEELTERLPSDRVHVARDAEEARVLSDPVSDWTDLTVPLFLALLVLLTLESFFASRFYRADAPPEETQTPAA